MRIFDRRLLVTAVSLLAVCGASAWAALLRQPITPDDYGPAAAVMAPVGREEPDQPQYLYLIKEYNGRVAVFARGEDTPERVLERMIHHLPTYDRIALREGVRVYTEQELWQRIEDYTS